MKHLFFVATAAILLPMASLGQASNNNGKQSGSKAGLKFIETIEISQAKVSDVALTDAETGKILLFPVAAKKNTTDAETAIETCSSLQFKYALLTDREVESISNISLYRFIDDWWGTRYRYGGSDKDGIDCSSFTGQLLQTVYKINLSRSAKDQYKQCEKLETDKLKEGDLVFFNTAGGISHVGVYLGNNYFVHSSTSSGVMISSLNDDYYSQHFISGGRPVIQQ